jgi:hypothetical protein
MKLIATLAAAALALGFAGSASAAPSGVHADTQSRIAQAGYYYYYRQGWRGNCFYRYIYVTDGYRYAYRWRRTCY